MQPAAAMMRRCIYISGSYRCKKGCVCGGHAYSVDGVQWFYPLIIGEAYTQFATITNSTVVEFSRRERPHIVLGKDGVTPIALTNGAGMDGVGKYGDHTWTFLQPLQLAYLGGHAGH